MPKIAQMDIIYVYLYIYIYVYIYMYISVCVYIYLLKILLNWKLYGDIPRYSQPTSYVMIRVSWNIGHLPSNSHVDRVKMINQLIP